MSIQLIIGTILALLKWSEVGMDVLEKSFEFIRMVNIDYDYQGFWKKGMDSLENLDFYRGTIRVCRNVMFQNIDHLNWILDFAVSSKMTSMDDWRISSSADPDLKKPATQKSYRSEPS